MRRRYYHDMLGYNFRLSDVHAAIGLAQMDRLEEITNKRRQNAAYLNANITSVIIPKTPDGFEHVWHQYTVRLTGDRDRDAAVKQLADAGIGTGIFYPVPVHEQGYMRQLVGEVELPVSERLAKEVFSLPVHPHLTQADLEKIVEHARWITLLMGVSVHITPHNLFDCSEKTVLRIFTNRQY